MSIKTRTERIEKKITQAQTDQLARIVIYTPGEKSESKDDKSASLIIYIPDNGR